MERGPGRDSDFCAGVYRPFGKPDTFKNVLTPRVGHVSTPEMWKQMLEWFDGHVKG